MSSERGRRAMTRVRRPSRAILPHSSSSLIKELEGEEKRRGIEGKGKGKRKYDRGNLIYRGIMIYIEGQQERYQDR